MDRYYVSTEKVPSKTKKCLDRLLQPSSKSITKVSQNTKRKYETQGASSSKRVRGSEEEDEDEFIDIPVKHATKRKQTTTRPTVPTLPLHLVKVRHSAAAREETSKESDVSSPLVVDSSLSGDVAQNSSMELSSSTKLDNETGDHELLESQGLPVAPESEEIIISESQEMVVSESLEQITIISESQSIVVSESQDLSKPEEQIAFPESESREQVTIITPQESVSESEDLSKPQEQIQIALSTPQENVESECIEQIVVVTEDILVSESRDLSHSQKQTATQEIVVTEDISRKFSLCQEHLPLSETEESSGSECSEQIAVTAFEPQENLPVSQEHVLVSEPQASESQEVIFSESKEQVAVSESQKILSQAPDAAVSESYDDLPISEGNHRSEVPESNSQSSLPDVNHDALLIPPSTGLSPSADHVALRDPSENHSPSNSQSLLNQVTSTPPTRSEKKIATRGLNSSNKKKTKSPRKSQGSPASDSLKFLGNFVKKHFSKHGDFYGIVVDFVSPYFQVIFANGVVSSFSSPCRQVIYEDNDREEFSIYQVRKYRCLEECVPRQLAIELERKHLKYLSKKPADHEGKLPDEEIEEIVGGDAHKPNEDEEANGFLSRIDYDSDMEI